MLPNGNMVLMGAGGTVLWSSQSACLSTNPSAIDGSPGGGFGFCVQDSGDLAVQHSGTGTKPIWTSAAPPRCSGEGPQQLASNGVGPVACMTAPQVSRACTPAV